MKILLKAFIALMTLALSAHARQAVVAYVPNWVNFDEFSKTLPYEKLTHINIAFENPDAQNHLTFHPKNDVLIRKAHENKVKILISIGGGGASENKALLKRYHDLLENEQRAAFVAELAKYVSDHQFDGIDIDLEGDTIDANYGAFIHDLSAKLKPQGKLLTAALSKGNGGDRVPDAALADLDLLNIMAYDATGTWSPNRPGQHSSMQYAKDCTVYWLGRGVPASKAVLGVPFYGYGFGKAFNKDGYSYRELVEKYPGAERNDQVGETIWYNGIPTIEAKTRFAISQKLGGIMIWSLDQDAAGDKSLLKAIDGVIKGSP